MNEQLAPDSLPFVMVHCPRCERKVLPWHDLDDGGEIMTRCLRCDDPLQPSPTDLLLRFTWTEVEQMGYGETEPDRLRSSGCSSGGCSGACATRS